MSIVLDIIVVAVVVLFALLGLRKGFLKSLMGFVGAVAALVLALTVARFAASWIFETWVRQPLADTISQALTESGAATAEGALDALPGYLTGLLGLADGGTEAIVGAIASSSSSLAAVLVTALAPVITNLIMVVLAIVLFFVFLLLVRLALRLLNRVAKAPVLRQVNGLLGFLFGMGKGLLVVWLLCALAGAAAPLWAGESAGWLQNAIEGSVLFRALSGANPVSIWLL